jgi:sulfhydrogenase subunit beta (sulfur reductase)
MAETALEANTTVAIAKQGLTTLLTNLGQMGYETIGPRIKDETVAYGQVTSIEDLPRGYTSEQKAGSYRLVNAGHANYFDIAPGQGSWKSYLFPPVAELARFQKEAGTWQLQAQKRKTAKQAFIGVRPCELAAILNQDRIFIRKEWQDPIYKARREKTFLVAVDCLHPCGTCFCASMGTGPDAKEGYDLCLTELEDVFLVKIGSESGSKVLSTIETKPASQAWLKTARTGIENAGKNMGRSISNLEGLPELLLNHLEAERWSQVAKHCLSCANCTQVCPTCFCWEMRDPINLQGDVTTRERVWDSCFNPDYSYVANGNTRPSVCSRYRQWLTHKFASWVHQFGQSGCVGCGRCITWCPARIDITEELAAIQQESSQ